MANWCGGVLKVRGPMENITKFLLEGIEYNDYQYVADDGKLLPEGVAVPRRNVEKEITSGKVYITNTKNLYIKDTRRMFISSDNITCYPHGYVIEYTSGEKVTLSLICIDVEQAWNIEAEDLAAISAKYGVDFRIFATESGLHFCQEIEVVDGKITMDRGIKYDDFAWEAPDPRIGG